MEFPPSSISDCSFSSKRAYSEFSRLRRITAAAFWKGGVKVRRRDRFLIVLLLGAAAAGFVLWRDLTLPQRALEKAKTQVLVENLELEREISGDLFTVHAKEARKMQDERIEASSLDVGANLAGGGRWQMRAVSGSLEPSGKILLSDVFARNLRKGTSLDVTAKEALWDPVRRQWDFAGGVLLRQGTMDAGGKSGVADPNGRVTLMGEAWATWERP